MTIVAPRSALWTCAASVVLALAGGCSSGGSKAAGPAASVSERPTNGKQALAALKEGNERFVAGRAINPSTDRQTLEIAAHDGQKPFASVLSCADSRIPVERVFDRGFGEIFVVRVAGNVTGQHETGSIEFSHAALKSPLLVVMGHTKCGAVKAACAGETVTPNIDSFLASIQPAVRRVRSERPDLSSDQFVAAVTQENVRQTLRDLYATSPLIREKVASGAVEVALAEVDVATGKVTWIDNVPKP